MTPNPANPGEMKMLPPAAGDCRRCRRVRAGRAVPRRRASGPTGITPAVAPARQMSEMPREELDHLAEEFGLDPTRYELRQDLVAAIHDRRQMIAAMDREAMLDVVRWGRRPVTVNASKEQIAQEIVRITSMRFVGLSQRGLVVLGPPPRPRAPATTSPCPCSSSRLKKKEGLFAKINRKRRAVLGSLVAKIVGEEAAPPITSSSRRRPAPAAGRRRRR